VNLLAPAVLATAATIGPAVISGCLVGLSMGLTGGGGAILAVPLLVYWLGEDPQVAVVISLATVAGTAIIGTAERARLKQVEFPTGLLFAAAGMLTAPLGSWLGEHLPPQLLLVSFAVLMLLIAARMWWRADQAIPPPAEACGPEGGPSCSRDPEGKLRLTSRCAMLLATIGLTVGLLSGLFGVGGGFLIVPALVTFASMGLSRAVGTSLLVMSLVGLAGVAGHLLQGREVPWEVTLLFVAGSVPGLFIGSALTRQLPRALLSKIFAAMILAVAVFVIARTMFG
jgi:uncharacterized membrane protein YfcA